MFEVQSFKPLALKFHREGYTNFREVRRERDYTSENHHVSWLYTARKAAEREYEALETLYPNVSAHSDRVVFVRRKTNTHEFELSRRYFELHGTTDSRSRPGGDADGLRAGYVHADMSEYNVAVGERGVTVFDWPQAVPTDHDNARELLARDAKNIVGYFRRKYPGEIDVDRDAVADAGDRRVRWSYRRTGRGSWPLVAHFWRFTDDSELGRSSLG